LRDFIVDLQRLHTSPQNPSEPSSDEAPAENPRPPSPSIVVA